MPNITIYLNDELYAKFLSSDEETKKAARESALKAIEKALIKGTEKR